MSRESTLRFRVQVVWLALISSGAFWAAGAWPEETPEERRERIESMDPAQKREIKRRQDWFEALSDAEKEQLRQLHRQIEEHPRAEELREVMRRYCEWVDGLPSHYSAELRGLPPDERINRVKELRNKTPHPRAMRPRRMWWPRVGEWPAGRPSPLGDEDRKGVIRWIEDCVDARAPKLVSALPGEEQKQVLQEMEEAKDQESRLAVFARLCRRRLQQGLEKRPLLDDASVKELEANLSADTRKRLAGVSSEERRLRLTGMVVRVLPVTEEELAKHMEKLKPEVQKYITSLPPEDQHRLLRFHYSWGRLPGPVPGRGPGSPRGPGGRGPPRGGQAKGIQAPGPPPDGSARPFGVKEPPPNGPKDPRPNGPRKPRPNGRMGPPANGANEPPRNGRKEPLPAGSGSSRRD